MENVRFGLARVLWCSQIQAVEAGIDEGSVIVAFRIAIVGGRRIYAYGEQVVGVGLKEGKRVRSNLADLGQEVRVTDFLEARDLLFTAETRQIILLFRKHPDDVAPNMFAQRGVRQKFRPRGLAHPGNGAIFAEGGAIIEHRGTEPAIKLPVVCLVE